MARLGQRLANLYWSSTVLEGTPDSANLAFLLDGSFNAGGRVFSFFAWPERGKP